MNPVPVGSFGRRRLVRAPRVRLAELGSSMARSPVAVRFEVADTSRAIAGLGRLVKRDCFPDVAPFRCSVVFACGKGQTVRRGGYGDPWSPWFNAFYGGYQVETSRPAWDRPFGFRAEGRGFSVDPVELRELGRADWDYLTAYPYGVPLAVIRARRAALAGAERACPEPVEVVPRARCVDGRWWDLVHFDDVAVVSGYVSGGDGAALATAHRVWSPLWRACFGLPTPRPDHPVSFPAVRMRARFLVSWDRVGASYRTIVCGGAVSRSVAPPDARRLLDAQLGALHPLLAAAGRARCPS